jgi:parallel beta-helix repeat protein
MKRGLLLSLVIIVIILIIFPIVNASIFDFLFNIWQQKPQQGEIYNCTIISEPGSYTLQNNIKSSGNTCIEIDAKEVLLDCGNKEIYFEGNLDDMVGIWIKTNSTTIKNCKIKNFSEGIWISNRRDGFDKNLYKIIISGSFLENNLEGIGARTTYGKFFDNTFVNNHVGIYLTGYSENNSLNNNFFNNSGFAAIEDLGIATTMENNVIENSQTYGLESAYGSKLYPKMIMGNKVKNCNSAGMHLIGAEGVRFVVTNNFIEGNGQGILCRHVDNITLESNIISRNHFDGIELLEIYNYSIKKNTIFLNNGSAIYIQNFVNREPSFNIVEENTLYKNSLSGIFIWNFSKNNFFLGNTINSNEGNGITIQFSSSNNTFLNNVICYNSPLDILNEGSENLGINNSCNSTTNWFEGNKTGCTFACIQSVQVNETQHLVCYMDGRTCVDYMGRYPPYCNGNAIMSYNCQNSRCMLNDAIPVCSDNQICVNGDCISQQEPTLQPTQCEQQGGMCAYSCPSGYSQTSLSCESNPTPNPNTNIISVTASAIFGIFDSIFSSSTESQTPVAVEIPSESPTQKICCMLTQTPVQTPISANNNSSTNSTNDSVTPISITPISMTASAIKESSKNILSPLWDFIKTLF